MILSQGIPANTIPSWPNFDPGLVPSQPVAVALNLPGGLGWLDPNSGRPARQNQWSINLQREFSSNLVAEVGYVANRGVWWPAPGLHNLNGITPQLLAAHGLNLADPNTQKLLTSPLNSPLAVANGFAAAPYPGFPLTNDVNQAIRPFPQFGFIPAINDPLGKTWYDSLQAKLTKRLSRGLFASAAFTWQKNLQQGVDSNNNTFINSPLNVVYNNILGGYQNAKSISAFDQPFLFVVSASYQVPRWNTYKPVSWLLRDWQVGVLLQYGSGLPIATPAATNNLNNQIFQPTLADRVPGQPLYLVPDLNCHCFDPNTTFVLNPKAWANPPAGTFGAGAEFYSDFRYERHPMENANINRDFRFGERVSLNLRLEFDNIFNRAYINNPQATTPFFPRSFTPGGAAAGGYGFINTVIGTTQFGQPRQGMIIARLTF